MGYKANKTVDAGPKRGRAHTGGARAGRQKRKSAGAKVTMREFQQALSEIARKKLEKLELTRDSLARSDGAQMKADDAAGHTFEGHVLET
jgi:hypothetical protein